MSHSHHIPTPEDFATARREGNDLLIESSDILRRFVELDDDAYRAGALDVAQKHLMGLAISITTHCDECVFYHLEECAAAGVNRRQLSEALDLSLVGVGSVVIPLLRRAVRFADQLEWTAEVT